MQANVLVSLQETDISLPSYIIHALQFLVHGAVPVELNFNRSDAVRTLIVVMGLYQFKKYKITEDSIQIIKWKP